MELEKDDVSGETRPEVYQQFICYQEKVNKRFQELEGMLGLAAQHLEKLKERKLKKKYKSDNPVAKTKRDCQDKAIHESLHHNKLSFPKFEEGSGVSRWIQDCEQYFAVFKVSDNKKVAIAGMHMQGTARKWFQIYIEENHSLKWPEFCKKFEARFGIGEQELLYDNCKHLQQTTTVEFYYAQFEKYQEQLREKMPSLTEAFFVECFIGGLKDKVKETLKLLNPVTVLQAYTLVKQCTEPGEMIKQDTTMELKEFPDLQMKSKQFKEPTNVFLETCTRKPIYDEEQGEGQECWPEQDFILAALNGDGFQHGCKQACQPKRTKEVLATSLVNKTNRVDEYGDKAKFVKYKDEETQGVVIKESSLVPTNIREVIADVLCRDSPTAVNSSGLEQKSGQLNKKIILIFDPGGLVQNKQFEVESSSGTKGWECTTDVMEPFASVLAAVVAYVPKKVHYKQKGESELRVAPTEMIYAVRKEWDQPKELNPETYPNIWID